MNPPQPASSGIQTFADGQSYIPSSKRADGSTRKEIKVRPGYKPPEDVERYKSRTAEVWRGRGNIGVPGAEANVPEKDNNENRSKNAKRREAARKKRETEEQGPAESVESGIAALSVENTDDLDGQGTEVRKDGESNNLDVEQNSEHQKKIRNQLKKLKAIRELKSKRAAGEKLAAEQLVKISKEPEIIRDLSKLDYHGPEVEETT